MAAVNVAQQIMAYDFEPHVFYISEDNFLSYQNSNLGISVDYPQDWKKIENDNGIGFFPLSSLGLQIPVGISIGAFPLNDNNMTKYLHNTLISYRESLPGFHLIHLDPVTLDGNQAYRIFFANTDQASGATAYTMQIFAPKNDKVYGITFEASGLEFLKTFPLVQKMVGSFRFTNSSGVTE